MGRGYTTYGAGRVVYRPAGLSEFEDEVGDEHPDEDMPDLVELPIRPGVLEPVDFPWSTRARRKRSRSRRRKNRQEFYARGRPASQSPDPVSSIAGRPRETEEFRPISGPRDRRLDVLRGREGLVPSSRTELPKGFAKEIATGVQIAGPEVLQTASKEEYRSDMAAVDEALADLLKAGGPVDPGSVELLTRRWAVIRRNRDQARRSDDHPRAATNDETQTRGLLEAFKPVMKKVVQAASRGSCPVEDATAFLVEVAAELDLTVAVHRETRRNLRPPRQQHGPEQRRQPLMAEAYFHRLSAIGASRTPLHPMTTPIAATAWDMALPAVCTTIFEQWRMWNVDPQHFVPTPCGLSTYQTSMGERSTCLTPETTPPSRRSSPPHHRVASKVVRPTEPPAEATAPQPEVASAVRVRSSSQKRSGSSRPENQAPLLRDAARRAGPPSTSSTTSVNQAAVFTCTDVRLRDQAATFASTDVRLRDQAAAEQRREANSTPASPAASCAKLRKRSADESPAGARTRSEPTVDNPPAWADPNCPRQYVYPVAGLHAPPEKIQVRLQRAEKAARHGNKEARREAKKEVVRLKDFRSVSRTYYQDRKAGVLRALDVWFRKEVRKMETTKSVSARDVGLRRACALLGLMEDMERHNASSPLVEELHYEFLAAQPRTDLVLYSGRGRCSIDEEGVYQEIRGVPARNPQQAEVKFQQTLDRIQDGSIHGVGALRPYAQKLEPYVQAYRGDGDYGLVATKHQWRAGSQEGSDASPERPAHGGGDAPLPAASGPASDAPAPMTFEEEVGEDVSQHLHFLEPTEAVASLSLEEVLWDKEVEDEQFDDAPRDFPPLTPAELANYGGVFLRDDI